jgi:hypothetical protein
VLTEPDLEASLVYEMKTPTATRSGAKRLYGGASTGFSCRHNLKNLPLTPKHPSTALVKNLMPPLGTICGNGRMLSDSNT